MKTDASGDRLIEALRNPSAPMQEKLNALKSIGKDLSVRSDLVWHMLLQSMAGMGNNRGYAGLILNKANYRKVAWATVKSLPRSKRLAHLHSALATAAVRMPGKKAGWLVDNFDRIEQMGGIAGALKRMRSLKGRPDKLAFFRQFSGIAEKYGRNIWMDLCDPDFRGSIAIDVRLRKMYSFLGIPIADYTRAEEAMLEIAREAGLTGWGLDRLLFHFTDHFLTVVGSAETSSQQLKQREKEEHPKIRGESIMACSGQNIGPISRNADSAGHKWERMYELFLGRRNTSKWGKRAEHAKVILHEFNNRVPLAPIVEDVQRKALCDKLFESSNDFNYVIYTLGMGVYLGALRREGEHLVVSRPGLL